MVINVHMMVNRIINMKMMGKISMWRKNISVRLMRFPLAQLINLFSLGGI